MSSSAEDVPTSLLEDERKMRLDEYEGLRRNNGPENPYRLHQELADVMWNNCGIWRTQKDLLGARESLKELASRARACNLIDDSSWTNQAVPFTRAVINMVEMSKAIVEGAIARDESRGAHFKMDTPQRDDEHWLKSTLATWTPSGPTIAYEPIDTRYIAPRARKYRINQNIVVKEIMGEDYLKNLVPSSAEPE
jgi:succinate dehydrogenase / fumarate reductase flavoprotein subunit